MLLPGRLPSWPSAAKCWLLQRAAGDHDRLPASSARTTDRASSVRTPGGSPNADLRPSGRLRILMVSHMPWRRDLGGPRVQIELADELRAMGHSVDKFSLEDALSGSKPPPLVAEVLPWFAAKAHRRILDDPAYDVIDAHQGTLTRSKKSLRFHGTLIVRSAGPFHFHAHYQWRADPHSSPGLRHQLGRLREKVSYGISQWAVERSFDAADRIIVHNQAEYDFLQLDPRWGRRTHIVPAPISTETLAALSAVRRQDALPHPATVAFVGSWHPLKGSRDWPQLARLISDAVPGVHFRFLGTGVEAVPSGLPPDVVWVPHYEPGELPGLLSSVQLGVFPSYLEGFGMAVVEQLAAGVPVVAYDIPGPRDILGPIDSALLVRPGYVEGVADQVRLLLHSDPADLRALRARCIARAEGLTWAQWVAPMIDYYTAGRDG